MGNGSRPFFLVQTSWTNSSIKRRHDMLISTPCKCNNFLKSRKKSFFLVATFFVRILLELYKNSFCAFPLDVVVFCGQKAMYDIALHLIFTGFSLKVKTKGT